MGNYTLYRAYYKQRRPSGSTGSWQTVLPLEISYTDGSGHTTVLEAQSTHCGWEPEPEPIYRWVNLPINSYYDCDEEYNMYYLQEKQISRDNGANWNDVSPAEYQRGAAYQTNSIDCGYVEPTGYSDQYLTVIALEDGYLYYNDVGRYGAFYSLDEGSTWQQYGTSLLLNSGDRVMWKRNGDTSGYFQFGIRVNVEGNIMSIFTGDNFRQAKSMVGFSIDAPFMRWNLISAENLVLPATTLANGCYGGMFEGCTGLTTPPSKLPATTLTNACYFNMFNGCTSMTTAPQLPATTLAVSCYEQMFSGCTSLTTAPQLPATALENECYQAMFCDCTSLATAPQLPATTLEFTRATYSSMFKGCTSLTTAPELPATILEGQSYESMFEGCTSLTTAPSVLPATVLKDKTYTSMFKGCTSLTTAPVISAMTLGDSCCHGMFANCSGLTTPPSILPATSLAYQCYRGMFSGCTSLATAPVLPATTLGYKCYEYMFYGCTSLTTAPQLPATTLTGYCYNEMFERCTSLTTAPVLSATTLVEGCYRSMFQYCSNLNAITCLATNITASQCTENWLSNVASNGTFTKASNMNDWTRDYKGIPSNWTVVDA